MRKIFLSLFFLAILGDFSFAGGIVTNANLSAAYIRMPSQDATMGIDAVYYNPAGLAFLEDGFHLSLSNQYIQQDRTITSTFKKNTTDYMDRREFKGGVTVPLFPSLYAVYKKNNLAVSFGFNVVGGGGSATYDNGLPSFEQQVAVIPATLTAKGIPTSQYSFESQFEGKSMMYGFQINGSYKINDKLAISLGARYILAKNSYSGYMRNIRINPNQPAFGASYNGTNMVSAPAFFTDAATTLNGWSSGATGMAGLISSKIAGGEAGTTLLASSSLSAGQIATVQGLLGAAGLTPAQIGAINIQTARATLAGAAPVFTSNATAMATNAALTADKQLDVTQDGSGITPIIGIDFRPSDKLNIGFRYEQRVKVDVKNKTSKDDVHLYPDGVVYSNDMPTTISLGISYKPIEKLSVSAGIHYYFDKTASYGKVKYRNATTGVPTEFYKNDTIIDNNFVEYAIGLEYKINEKILVSFGFLGTKTGVNSTFQSDLSHSLSASTFGAGLKYNLNKNIGINFGAMYSIYPDNTKAFPALAATATSLAVAAYEETYKRKAVVVGLGIDFRF